MNTSPSIHSVPVASPSLSGRTILITRASGQSSELRSLLEARGASVICFPTIAIRDPASWDACDRAVWKLAEFDAVCFTSRNAVEKFVERIRSLRPQAVDTLGTRTIFAVGERTQRSLESLGFSVTAAPAQASADELGRMLRAQKLDGMKILFPGSDIAREVLPDQLRASGAIVEEITVYQTAVPEPENLDHVRSMLARNDIHAAVFFSPSSILNFVEMVGREQLGRTAVAVIGSTTAEAAGHLGIRPAIIAVRATTEGMVDAIEKYYVSNTEVK